MKLYNDIDDFIIEMFPQEAEKMSRQRSSDIEESIDRIDNGFSEALAEILSGEQKNGKENNL